MHSEELRIPVDEVLLHADLALPDDPRGLVVFAHGSGSGRRSPRNRYVARRFVERLGVVLVDLLSDEEAERDARTGELRFDVPLLAHRLGRVSEWLAMHPALHGLPIGYYGSSTGAAAALMAAAERPAHISAVVSRGGRPDLATDALPRVHAPTLFIVGGEDRAVLRLNDRARPLLPVSSALYIVPRASHLFEEPGALDEVAELAFDWFIRWLPAEETVRPSGGPP
jgi:pimeloyl-ACP methyl ester carboxylesterase